MNHRNRLAGRLLCVLAATAALAHADGAGNGDTFLVHLGFLTLRPSGFLDAISSTRSASDSDSISTGFGKFPLTSQTGQTIVSLRNSRLALKGDLALGPVRIAGYMESDFLNTTPAQSNWRWRQYWAQARMGRWELTGGQEWSMLRPNREGIASETALMNTDVIDAGYHVGLLGYRRRQVRLARTLGAYKAAVAWEASGNWVAKVVRDSEKLHLELGGLSGRSGRRGVTASAVAKVASRVRVVTQQSWSRHALFEALNTVPVGASGVATIEGVELDITRNTEVYFYGGLVYGEHSSGNRVVGEWTAGANRKLGRKVFFSGFLLSLEYSHLNRTVWTGASGAMDYLMTRFRYSFN
jgi:hypothetical protein